ncbi:MAG: hypothetical protein IJU23_04080 [Proteobacteria bacterium]|nr:hypothetical protein [Pseudomonadota bacterium]
METRILRYLHQPLRYDWRKKLARCLEIDSDNVVDMVRALADYQTDCGLKPSGFVDCETRLRLIEEFPVLRLQCIGNHLDERCIVDESQTESGIFDCLKHILLSQDSIVFEEAYCPQILAIRGVERRGHGWFQTGSASRFVQTPFGARTHFSSNKNNYQDTLMAVMWCEPGMQRVRLFSGVCNPSSLWPHGTAHLASGQYFFKIGRHRTRETAHIESVRSASLQWPQDWVFDNTNDSIQYIALEGTSSIEVIRSHGDYLDLCEDDFFKAETGIAHADPVYVDAQRIKINIHTCAVDHASSLGCQNILPQDYADFMSSLLDCRRKQIERYGFEVEIPYTLCDASYIE